MNLLLKCRFKIIFILILVISLNATAQQAPITSKPSGLVSKYGNAGNDSDNLFGRSRFTSDSFKNCEHNFAGRKLLKNPLPNNKTAISGRVVLSVSINAKGNVSKIYGVASGTTTSDSMLIKLANKAAMKAKFNAVDSIPEQKGKLRFIFIKK